MKFSKLSQLFLVSAIGLLVATLLTACQIVTIDYVFVAGSEGSGTGSTGQIETYAVDSESGALRAGGATVASGGVNPVSMALTSDYANLYVANAGSNSVSHFTIALNGALTVKDTVTLPAAPVAVAVDAANATLYVVSGSSIPTLTAYPLSSGTIGAAGTPQPLSIPGYTGDTLVATGLRVLGNSDAVFVTAYDQSAYNPGGTVSSTANPGWVFSFATGSGGTLTPAPNSPYKAGVKPTAIVSDPTFRFVYVTDFASNQLIGYSVQSGYVLNFLQNGPFRTGNEPASLAIDPRGKYIYVANALDSSITAYSIELSTGTPTTVVNTTGSATNSTDTQPVDIIVDPALGRFVYTANFLGNSVSGFRLNPNTGTLETTQATPYPTTSLVKPTALVSVPHGNHSLQSVTP
jgi:6-phosphogluconolactonase (cycloisomerase 2 family)